MTTILFDGVTLVADSRRTHGVNHDDTACKILKVKGATYKGEKVLLIAASGPLMLLRAVTQSFVDEPDTFEKRFEDFYDIFKSARQGSRPLSCGVIFITNKDAYSFRVNDAVSPKISSYGRTPVFDMVKAGKSVFMALGSGGPDAITMRRLFSMPTHLCIALLGGIKHTSTGGALTTASVVGGKIEAIRTIVYDDYAAVHREALEWLRSDNCVYDGVLPDMTVPIIKSGRAKDIIASVEKKVEVIEVAVVKKATTKRDKKP